MRLCSSGNAAMRLCGSAAVQLCGWAGLCSLVLPVPAMGNRSLRASLDTFGQGIFSNSEFVAMPRFEGSRKLDETVIKGLKFIYRNDILMFSTNQRHMMY